MIKNVIFDCGQVLVHFEPEYMVAPYVQDEADKKVLKEVVFDRLYWDRLDAGDMSDEEFCEAIKTRLDKRLWATAEKIYYDWIYNIPEIDGMRELITLIRERYGASIFVLSNISKYFARHKSEIPILSLVDKCICSSECGMQKPDPRIYEYLCQECNIRAEESVFVDDRAENVESAKSIGMQGFVFSKNIAELKDYLTAILEE